MGSKINFVIFQKAIYHIIFKRESLQSNLHYKRGKISKTIHYYNQITKENEKFKIKEKKLQHHAVVLVRRRKKHEGVAKISTNMTLKRMSKNPIQKKFLLINSTKI